MRIKWDDNEKKDLCENVARRIMIRPDITLLTHVSNAQTEILPSNRRRKILSITSIPWLIKGMKEYYGNFQNNLTKKENHIQETCQQEIERLIQKMTYEKEEAVSQAIKNLTIEDLITNFLLKLKEEKEQTRKTLFEIQSKLDTLLSKPQSSSVSLSSIAESKKVTIIGLIANQQNVIENKYKSVLKLRFIPANQSKKTFPKDCDAIIVMTKFTGHDWINSANCQKDKSKIIMCGGGISSLNEHLDKIIKGQILATS